jgi:glycosyltransferase involved in cell wall biosynthesis
MKKHVGIILINDLSIDVRVLNEINILKEKFSIHVLCGAERIQHPDKLADLDLTLVQTGSIVDKFRFISDTTLGLFQSFWKKKIKKFIREIQPDLLHVHDLYMLPPAILSAHGKDLPVIVDLHENYHAAFQTYSWTKKFPHRLFVNYGHWKKVEKEFLPKAEGIIALSEEYKDLLQKQYPKLNSTSFAIYPNVPDMEFFNQQESAEENRDSTLRIFYFGMIGRSRGLHIASRGVRLLREKGIDAELHIAGKVHKNDRLYFENEVMAEYVEHIPWIPLNELGQYLAKMDIAISPILKNPQHESGIANKVYQYMYFAKPILVSNCAPQQTLAESEECGLSHKDDSAHDFAKQAEFLANHPEEREKMGKNGRRAVLEKFNTEHMGERIVALYEKVLVSRS